MPPDLTKRATTRIACAQHTAPYLRAELKTLGFQVQDEHPTGLDIGATLPEAMALALRLRTATHVMWLLARFRCPSPKALYKEIAAYPWEDLIPPDPPAGYFSIRASSDTPTVDNQMYPALVAKDAIADRFTRKLGRRPDAGPDRTGVVLNLYWKDDRAAIFLNLNGRPLSDRGYRRLPHHAPMRETLAASVLLAMGYDGSTPLVNPMCGSGTLAIEAALIAANRAPGLLRSDYAVLKTILPVQDAWRDARARVKREGAAPDSPRRERGALEAAESAIPPIIASDHDPAALDAARKNAQAAGVDHLIDFVECDFRDTPLGRGAAPASAGHVVLNPEYGERMGDPAELERTYKAIGDFFKQRCPGWTGHVFTGSRDLAKHLGLRPARRLPFKNGAIECRLLTFEMYEGTRAASDNGADNA